MAEWEIRLGCKTHKNCLCCVCLIFWSWNRTVLNFMVGKDVFKIDMSPDIA